MRPHLRKWMMFFRRIAIQLHIIMFCRTAAAADLWTFLTKLIELEKAAGIRKSSDFLFCGDKMENHSWKNSENDALEVLKIWQGLQNNLARMMVGMGFKMLLAMLLLLASAWVRRQRAKLKTRLLQKSLFICGMRLNTSFDTPSCS
ncbi:hypothetical protein OIU77_018526 [Salix suchowensis]|uniref:Uncharacterized protein n=1 Tax=Salix suchowensis TaxID=1278906 RepID=A0ABQ9CFU5_9ROSI|nr:hypothetical protein OIU77_018526 [Salix suchowensis]